MKTARQQRLEVIQSQLEAWAETLAGFDVQMDAAYELFGTPTDSPFMDAVNRLEDAYTRMKAEQVGDTGCVWLHWWRWECEMGRKPMGAAAPGKPVRTIRTLKQLATLIVADSDA